MFPNKTLYCHTFTFLPLHTLWKCSYQALFSLIFPLSLQSRRCVDILGDQVLKRHLGRQSLFTFTVLVFFNHRALRINDSLKIDIEI